MVKEVKERKLRSFGRKKRTLLFEVGRICIVNYGEDAGKLCVILDFVDSTRALVDGPESITGVARGTIPFRRLSCTSLYMKILKSARTRRVEEAFKANNIAAKFAKLPWGRKLARNKKRMNLTDYDRFQVMLLRKKRSALLKKQIAHEKVLISNEKAGVKTQKQLWAEAIAAGAEEIPERVTKSYLEYALKIKEYWAKKAADPNDNDKRPKNRLARSKKRSKKRSKAHWVARRVYSKQMKKKRKQTARMVRKEDKKMRRVRLKKTFHMRVAPRGATALPKVANASDVKMHLIRYKHRRAKFKRNVRKARVAKAREAKKKLKEYKEAQRATAKENKEKGIKVSKRKPKKAKQDK